MIANYEMVVKRKNQLCVPFEVLSTASFLLGLYDAILMGGYQRSVEYGCHGS